MREGGSYTSGKTTGGKCGCAVAALLGLVFTVIVTGFTLLTCPRDGDCQTEAALVFWGGLLAGAIIAGAAGLLVRTLVNGWLARRQTETDSSLDAEERQSIKRHAFNATRRSFLDRLKRPGTS